MTRPTSLRSLRDSMRASFRRAIERGAAARSPTTALLRTAFEWGGPVPGIGPDCRRWAGLIRARGGDPARARDHYRAAVAGGLDTASLHYDLGQSLASVGSFAEAEAEFRLAMDRAPEAAWPVWGLVSAMEGQGRSVPLIADLIAAARRLSPDEARKLPFPSWVAEGVSKDPVLVDDLAAFVAEHPAADRAAVLLGRVEAVRGNGARSTALYRAAAAVRFHGREDPSASEATPTFLILGQAKAGTSALFQYLSAHPAMVPPLAKEPQYWSTKYGLGPNWYRSQFPRLAAGSGLFTGEGSADYLVDADAPARVARGIPSARLVVLLREPVSRAHSEYWMLRRSGVSMPSFEEMVAGEMTRRPDCPLDERSLGDVEAGPASFLARSAALPFLQRWLAHVSPRQLLVLRTEHLARDLPGTMARICRFIGVPVHVPTDRRRHNEGRYPALSPPIETTLQAWFEPHERALEDFLVRLPQATP